MFKKLISGIILILSLFICTVVQANVKLKILAVNPSSTEEQVAQVTFDLPKGINPQDVIDTGEMELRYDFDKGAYYVYQEVTLNPGEKRTFEVKLRDVWVMPDKDMDFLKKHTKALAGELKDTKYREVAGALTESIENRLDEIIKKQKDVSLTVKQRIDLYYDHKRIVEDIKADIGMLENLVIDAGGVLDERLGKEEVKVVSLDEKKEREEPIKLNIKITNPSEKLSQEAPLKYYLPKEVSPKDILDRGGLEVGYDLQEECFYFYKDKVELKPAGTKSFLIKINDIWKISQIEIETLIEHTRGLIALLKGTEFFPQAKSLGDKIVSNLEGIEKSQEKKVSTDEHIGRYRNNLDVFKKTKEDIVYLEKMIARTGGTPPLTVARIEKGERTRPKGYEGIELIAKSIFKGKAPTAATTWKIIWIIISFLAIVSILFFMLQLVQRKRIMFDKLTGVFNREYTIERLEEELSISKHGNTKCSLLMMDMDKFKNINDEYGHAVGDSILREFVVSIRKGLRKNDVVGRYGGDEFIVILPSADKKHTLEIAERLRMSVAGHIFKIKDRLLKITASIGLVIYPDDSTTVMDMFFKADAAMYKAKSRGGNAVAEVAHV